MHPSLNVVYKRNNEPLEKANFSFEHKCQFLKLLGLRVRTGGHVLLTTLGVICMESVCAYPVHVVTVSVGSYVHQSSYVW